MGHLPARWNAFIVALALTTLVGCQGFSSGKSNTQGTQTLPGALTAAPASVTFGNVQLGTSQTQSDTLSNTGSSSLTVTAATMSGAGFTTAGLNLPLTLDVGQSVSFSIIFAPQTAGSASGNLALTNSASSNPSNIALTGTGVATGGLTGIPASFSFGNVQVGLSQSQTETLNNTSSQSFTLTQATFSGTGFSTSGLSLPMTLGPNQSASFAVVFTPTTVGAANGTLSIAVSGSSTTLDFALSGIGVAPATLSATPASLTFTSVQVGQTQSQTETVRNVGGTNTTISQATVSGSGFSIAGLATPLTLTPGQSASFSVTYAPQSAGSVSGSLMIDSDATNPALSVTLSGTAVTQSQGTLTATPVNAGSVVVGNNGSQTGTLTASGASVSVTSVSLSGANPSEFSISGIAFPVTVTTTQPVTFTVNFTAGSSGAASATASFASTAANTPNTASLTGTGTAPPIHSVELSWKASTTTGLSSYNVYRAIFTANVCGSYSNVGSTASSVTTFTDNLVTDGTTYCYATTAVDAEGESSYSNIVQATIPAS